MKKIYCFIFVLIVLAGGSASCNFLDIVPDEMPTEEDAFKDARAAERYLYSCYSFIPQNRHSTQSIDLFTADEIVTAFEHELFANFAKGNYSASNPILTDWNTLFEGIRQCYLLLDNVNSVPGLSDVQKKEYASEATFIIAYIHFILLRSYGPVMIIPSTPDVNMPIADYPARSTYDECVNWIAAKFDEAISMGLAKRHTGTYYGRATAVAAKAIKARMLLYAASPLFNGGKTSYTDFDADNLSTEYARFTNTDGTQLISTTYDPAKWQKAADAALDAINQAVADGYALYDSGTATDDMPYPDDPVQRKLRMTIIDKNSKEILWADTRQEDTYGLQNKSAPRGASISWNGIAPTLTMLETFYTENGLPIDEDPDYNYIDRYKYSVYDKLPVTGTDDPGKDQVTLNLNQKREPRFDAWIAYHNSYYEYNRDGKGLIKVRFKRDDVNGKGTRTDNYSPTGYLTKKGQHPLSSQGGSSGNVTQKYPWSLVRLAELYLNYAEALIEVGGQSNLDLAVSYIDKVRTRAGIDPLKTAWAKVPGAVLNQDKLRKIVRQERSIELFLENHRFWDVRRWLLGSKYFNVKAKGLNVDGTSNDAFFQVVEVNFQRRFEVPQYLMPLPIGDLQKNTKLVQNPGY
ncbi:MAG: RagB/SusD family nutrient uptake outer membrane protein [Prevotella sp.]|jgi:hypothetical protein|nr:RagB/SusD family nutrient uptake outer membrane protein [Prevotella sp.]